VVEGFVWEFALWSYVMIPGLAFAFAGWHESKIRCFHDALRERSGLRHRNHCYVLGP